MVIPDTNNVMQVGSESQETWDTGPALPFQNAGAASALPIYSGPPFSHLQSEGRARHLHLSRPLLFDMSGFYIWKAHLTYHLCTFFFFLEKSIVVVDTEYYRL